MNLAGVAAWLTYPPGLTLCVLAVAWLAFAHGRRRAAHVLAALGVAWSLAWSLPGCSDWLRSSLERMQPRVAAEALPQADAVVVLGGGRIGAWAHRDTIDPDELHTSRIAAGARAWLAGRAPRVVLSGGLGKEGVSQAEAMAQVIVKMGVPRSALVLEKDSADTSENARLTAQWAREHGARRIILVTSGVHMPRASTLFRGQGLEVVPLPVSERRLSARPGQRSWKPSLRALWRSGRGLKEYLGLLALHARASLGA